MTRDLFASKLSESAYFANLELDPKWNRLLECNGFRGNREMALTQGPGGGNLAEGSCAHFIVRQDAELVVGGRRQACHL